MFRPLSLFIGLRYTRAKRRNHFISFISISSMVGIALGVMVLITVLSVMNGFDQAIKDRIFSLAFQISMSTTNNLLPDWQKTDDMVKNYPGVVGSAPYVAGQGMMTNNGVVQGSFLWGVDPQRENQVSELESKMVTGSINDLKPKSYGIILGQDLASDLGVIPGDKLLVIAPVASVTPVGVVGRSKRFTVTGIFDAGSGFGYNNRFAYINLQDAQTFFRLGTDVSGLRLKLKDLYQAPDIARKIINILPPEFMITDWTVQYGAFFQALALQKTMMFLILFLIIAVALFNLVSSLVMTVTDKQSDIAILRTLGATPRQIMGIFITQGSILGLTGMLIGLVGGILLSQHIMLFYNFIKNTFHLQLLSTGVFYVDYLPSHLEIKDVIEVCLIAVCMSFIANIYPAWRASRVNPAEALRYE